MLPECLGLTDLFWSLTVNPTGPGSPLDPFSPFSPFKSYYTESQNLAWSLGCFCAYENIYVLQIGKPYLTNKLT